MDVIHSTLRRPWRWPTEAPSGLALSPFHVAPSLTEPPSPAQWKLPGSPGTCPLPARNQPRLRTLAPGCSQPHCRGSRQQCQGVTGACRAGPGSGVRPPCRPSWVRVGAPVRTAVSVLLLLLQAASPCALMTPLRSPLLAAFTVVLLAGSRRRRGGAHSALPPAATPSDY